LQLDSGTFLFQSTINLPGHFVLRGLNAQHSRLVFDLNGSGNAIQCYGALLPTPYTLMEAATTFQSHVVVNNASAFAANDFIKVSLNDSLLVTSSWAYGSVAQLARVDHVNGDTLFLQSELRMDFPMNLHPKIQKVLCKTNCGIECLSIQRMDNTAPQQTSSISYYCAANCWIQGVESNYCTFAHVQASNSCNLAIRHSYFHDAFEYGDGGRGYGVDLEFSTGECLVENNVFQHLRHSMLLQAGANGNAFTYNFSTDPFWETSTPFIPSNSAGECVLHGNYVFRNLFEMNSVGNMVIDNSHGANGPYNTFLRNRGALFGIFFSDATSPSQNFIGNEIPNTTFPYSAVNYTLQGNDHFEYANNNKGVITPAGSELLPTLSYIYSSTPSFVDNENFASIGSPNAMGSGIIPSEERALLSAPLAGSCGVELPIYVEEIVQPNVVVYPNPNTGRFAIQSNETILYVTFFDIQGKVLRKDFIFQSNAQLSMSEFKTGVYLIRIETLSCASQRLIIRE
jgi:hypothetical protein